VGVFLSWFSTYSLDEALTLFAHFQSQKSTSLELLKILVLAPLVAQNAKKLFDDARQNRILSSSAIRVTVTDIASAIALHEILAENGIASLPVHVQIDTGLTRAGASLFEAPALLDRIATLPRLQLEGIYTHLSHGDEPAHPTIQNQFMHLSGIAFPWKAKNPYLMVHVQNSGGAWNTAPAGCNMVRLGIALYGLQPSAHYPIPDIQPIARLTAPILAIHEAPADTGVGYGHTFTTRQASRLAIVPVGYGDGYPRALSNRGIVQVGEKNCAVVGRVSMDQIIIDVTNTAAAVGDTVTVISNDPAAPNCVDAIATACDTIGYEIATGFGFRLNRLWVE